MTRHDEICLKESWMNNDAQRLKKKDVWSEMQSSTKKMRFVYWLI